MAGLITAEKQVIANPADTYGYTAEQRALAASVRSVVTVADRAEAESVATAMAADGRPVSDTNILVVFNRAKRGLEVKDGTGWVNAGSRIGLYRGGAVTVPANSLWGLGTLTEDVTSDGSINNDFVTNSGEVFTFTKLGTYACQTFVIGSGAPPNGWVGWRKGDDSAIHTEQGIGSSTSWAVTHTVHLTPRAVNETARLRIYLPSSWSITQSVTTIVKIA